ncbi:MAG TPA: response regulator [Bacteroidota bacterium]|jgi:DNA-binding response OmpR family regulator
MPGSGKGILIAEDDEEIRRLLAVVFRLENFVVFEAEDGIDAREIFKQHANEIHLVITDLGLPGLGGVELIEQIRAISPSVKIIGASGFGKSNVVEEVMNAGGDDFLSKPFNTEDLMSLTHRLLQNGGAL